MYSHSMIPMHLIHKTARLQEIEQRYKNQNKRKQQQYPKYHDPLDGKPALLRTLSSLEFCFKSEVRSDCATPETQYPTDDSAEPSY